MGLSKKTKTDRIARHICYRCGLNACELAYTLCSVCRAKDKAHKRKIYYQKIDKLIDYGLIPTEQAAEILGISKGKVILRARLKILKVRAILYRTFYFKEIDVLAEKKVMEKSKNTIYRCVSCGYEQHPNLRKTPKFFSCSKCGRTKAEIILKGLNASNS